MTAESEGMVDRIKQDAEETKEGIQDTYEDLPGDSAGQKVKGVFSQAVHDVKTARDATDNESANETHGDHPTG